MPSKEGIEKLKADWVKDPNWDIENTEGFEAHREELKAFADQKNAEWELAYDRQRQAEKAIANAPAFPEIRTDEAICNHSAGGYGETYSVGGLSKREYFAAMALQGLLASDYTGTFGEMVTRAVTVTDLLIARLAKEDK